MNNRFNLSLFSIKILLRRRALMVLISFLALYSLFFYYIDSMYDNMPSKVFLDITLSFESISLFLLILFMVSLEIPEEIRFKKIYFFLSQGLTRSDYIFGKFIAYFLVSISYLISFNIFVSILWKIFQIDKIAIFWNVLPILILKSLIGISIFLFISLFFNGVLTLVFGLLLYFICSFKYFLDYAAANGNILAFVFKKMGYILPNLEFYNIQNAFIHNINIPSSYNLALFIYTLIFTFFILKSAVFFFRRKEL